VAVRWHELFDDLEAQADALARAERDGEVADRIRSEVGRLALVNRLRGALDRQVTVQLLGAGPLAGRLDRVGRDWALFTAPHEVLVPVGAIALVVDLPWDAVSPEAVGAIETRLSLSSALRMIAMDRARVTVTLRDGTTVSGTPDRVGSDYVDVAEHDDLAPRAAAVRVRATVPHVAIAKVTRELGTWT
jgi:hypothetical protein